MMNSWKGKMKHRQAEQTGVDRRKFTEVKEARAWARRNGYQRTLVVMAPGDVVEWVNRLRGCV